MLCHQPSTPSSISRKYSMFELLSDHCGDCIEEVGPFPRMHRDEEHQSPRLLMAEGGTNRYRDYRLATLSGDGRRSGDSDCRNWRSPNTGSNNKRNQDTNRDQDRGGSGSHRGKQRASLDTMRDQLQTDPHQALLSVVVPQFGLQNCFDQENMSPKTMRVLLELLCHCLEVRLPQSCVCLLTMMHRSHVFIQSMTSFVSKSPYETDLLHLLSICQRSLQYIPVLSDDNTTRLLSHINTVIMNDFRLKTDLAKNLSKVEQMKHRKVAKEEEEFRSMSVTPTLEELLSDEVAFPRDIQTTDGHESLEHYLDTHFRLLREDFINPMREGIQELLKSKEMTSETSLANFSAIRFYRKIYINMPLAGKNNGMVSMLTFDVSTLSEVNWEHSKLFIVGTLLCLSADNFKSAIFATVLNRDTNQLKKGRILVELDEHWVDFDHDVEYEMIESKMYFNTYKYSLKRMQKIHKLPFNEYFLKAEIGDVKPPVYLNLADKEFPALEMSKWPKKEELKMNECQYHAFQNALTKEVSVIWGPPGTGKTYLGLKIVDSLLKNKTAWREDNTGCILIVCYTNHALDLFVKGVVRQSNLKPGELVRIGRRSESTEWNKFHIVDLQNNAEKRSWLNKSIGHITWERAQLKDKIAALHKSLALSKAALRPIDELMYAMTKEQVTSMRSMDGVRYRCVVTAWLLMEDKKQQSLPDMSHKDCEVPSTFSWAQNAVTEAQDGEFSELKVYQDMFDIADQRERLIQKSIERIHLIEDKIDGTQIVHKNQRKKVKWLLMSLAKGHCADMNHEEVTSINDVCALDEQERFRLYQSWLRMLNTSVKLKLKDVYAQYNDLSERLNEAYAIANGLILKDAFVVAMTTSCVAKQKEIMSQLTPTITIIEEAAELLEAHVIPVLSSKCQQLILIGDLQQVRSRTVCCGLTKTYDPGVSMFERFVKNETCYSQLNLQHRMRPEIARLLTPHIYKEFYNHDSVLNRDDIKGIHGNVFFINHEELDTKVEDTLYYCNDHEATFIVRLLRYLLIQGYQPTQITVLTMHRWQMNLVKKKLGELVLDDLVDVVRVTPVHDYQGEESDIILLSCVGSIAENEIGSLNVNTRVCIALSRAKIGLYCVGNISLLREAGTLWEKISSDLDKEGLVVDGLPCFCPNHPDTEFVARVPSDFDHAPCGGCTLPCSFRLNCGHTCKWLCHPYNKQHKDYLCRKPCTKSCVEGHPCPSLCHETCPPCETLQTKIISKCQHEQMVPCHISPDIFLCQASCNRQQDCDHNCEKPCGIPCFPCEKLVLKVLPQCEHRQMVPCHQDVLTIKCTGACEKDRPCGHPCQQVCSEECSEKCTVLVPDRQWPCGHTLTLPCWQTPENTNCTSQVKTKLSCGHEEQVDCGEDGHAACSQRCTQLLLCGHLCQGKCSERPCPPCKMKCEGGCCHTPCSSFCGSPCYWCFKQCEWSCEHARCDLKCWEPCERDPCNEPCPKYLSCGHQCLGLCGEDCPLLCKVCHSDVCKQITQRTPDEALIVLSPCYHTFSVQELDDHFKPQMPPCDQQPVQMPCCPICKEVVKTCNRYNAVIKQAALDWNRIKIMPTLEKYTPVLARFDEEPRGSVERYLIDRVKEFQKLLPNSRDHKTVLSYGTMYNQIVKLYRICSGQVDIVKEVLFPLRKPEDDINEVSSCWVKCPSGHIRSAHPTSTEECPDCRNKKRLQWLTENDIKI